MRTNRKLSEMHWFETQPDYYCLQLHLHKFYIFQYLRHNLYSISICCSVTFFWLNQIFGSEFHIENEPKILCLIRIYLYILLSTLWTSNICCAIKQSYSVWGTSFSGFATQSGMSNCPSDRQNRARSTVRRSPILGKINCVRMAVFTSFDDFQIFFFKVFISFPFPVHFRFKFFCDVLKNALGNILGNIFWIVDSGFFWRTFLEFWHFYMFLVTTVIPWFFEKLQDFSKLFFVNWFKNSLRSSNKSLITLLYTHINLRYIDEESSTQKKNIFQISPS